MPDSQENVNLFFAFGWETFWPFQLQYVFSLVLEYLYFISNSSTKLTSAVNVDFHRLQQLKLRGERPTQKGMVLDNLLSSPHRRSPSFRRQFQRDEVGNWSTLFQRHRFLLTALALLAFLCTIYLYFAVTLGDSGTCSGLSGGRRAQCHLEMAKNSAKGKLRFL